VVNADLIRDLGRPDRHEAAADSLVTLGAGGVEQLVREVMDTGCPVDWRPITAVLGRIGDAGFDGLLQGLVSAPTEESRERVGFAFSRLGVWGQRRLLRPALRLSRSAPKAVPTACP